jgi:hypothetical protein
MRIVRACLLARARSGAPAVARRARHLGGRIRHVAAADDNVYLGGVEVSQAVAIDRKVMLVARSLGDGRRRPTSPMPT